MPYRYSPSLQLLLVAASSNGAVQIPACVQLWTWGKCHPIYFWRGQCSISTNYIFSSNTSRFTLFGMHINAVKPHECLAPVATLRCRYPLLLAVRCLYTVTVLPPGVAILVLRRQDAAPRTHVPTQAHFLTLEKLITAGGNKMRYKYLQHIVQIQIPTSWYKYTNRALIQGMVGDFSFFDFSSPFCYLLIEFHCTFFHFL